MPPSKVSDEDLMAALAGVFRRQGYAGATMAQFEQASGLKKASLYHRFPNGKDQMAAAVADWIAAHMERDVFGELKGASPAADARKVAAGLDRFYSGGQIPCLLDALSLGDMEAGVNESVADAYERAIAGLAMIARSAGANAREARRRAETALERIEGALIVGRASGNRRPFKRAIRELPELLTGPYAARSMSP